MRNPGDFNELENCVTIPKPATDNDLKVQLFELAHEAILVVNEAGEIVSCNSRSETMFGYNRSDLIGKKVETLIPFRYRKAHVRNRKIFHAHPKTRSMGTGLDLVGRRKDGSQFFVDISLTPIESRSRRLVAAIIRDATVRKHIESELKIRLKQQEALTALSSLALQGGIDDILNAAVRTVADTLNVDCTKVLELSPAGDYLILKAGVGWTSGIVGNAVVPSRNDSQAGYTLTCRTPVIVKDLRLEQRFNGPSLLTDHNVVSGMSVIIQGRDRPYGVLGAHSRRLREFSPDDIQFLQAVANILAQTIERAWLEDSRYELVRNIATGISASTGDAFFRSLVEYLAKTLEVNYAVIAELSPDDPMHVQTIAVWADGQISGNFDYALADTPCADVMSSTTCVYPDDVQALFPVDRVLRDMKCRGYAGTPLVDSAGKTVGLIAVMSKSPLQDTTIVEHLLKIFAVRASGELERRRAEKVIDKNQRQLRALYDNTLDAILLCDNAGQIVDANPAAHSLFGSSLQQPGTRIFDLIPDAFRNIASTRWNIFLTVGKAAGESHIVAADQSKRVVEYRSVANILPDLHLAVLRDTTERKKREDELVRLANIVESSQDAIIAIFDNKIASWNSGAERMYGYTRNEIIGSPPSILVPENRRHEIPEIISKLEQGRTVDYYDTVRRRKDGKMIHVSIRLSPVKDRNGGIVGTSSIARDITRQKELEVQFMQSQKMDAIGKLAAGIAHDFNNLLTIVLGYTNLIRDELYPESPIRDKVYEIQKTVRRASELTKHLLAFSRKQVLAPQPVDLNAIVAGMHKMFIHVIGEQIELKLALADTIGIVKADPTQIEQVLMNLIVNARDAMPQGGQLTIETSSVVLDDTSPQSGFSLPPGPYVVLAVTDSGVGIEAELLPHIFEPFFTTKSVGDGTGLGLSTVYGIVKQSGGHTTVESDPHRGTTFKVYLPQLQKRPDLPLRDETKPDWITGTGTILLVEDESGVREVSRRVLEQSGFAVLAAANATEALKLLETASNIQVLVTDVVLPGLSGIELAEKVSKLLPACAIVYMSGYTDNAVSHTGLWQRGRNFLEKPFTPESLLLQVQKSLNQSRPQ